MRYMGKKPSSSRHIAVISVRVSPLDKRLAHLRFGSVHMHAALGEGGITIFKREGDGATPVGSMAILSGFRNGRLRISAPCPLDLVRTGNRHGWCDASTHASYNQPVRLPFSASHEQLLRDDCLYDFALVLDYNITSRKRGAGSAIFFHVAKPGYRPTRGCIAVSRRDMIRLLPYLRRGTMMVVQSG